MRVLLFLGGLLILANVGFMLWPDSGREAAHIYAPKRDINPHFVRLNKEVEDNFYAAQSYQLTAATPTEINLEGENCFRLGPFMHQTNFELAQAVLFNAGVVFSAVTRPSKAADVYRLYLGPFAEKGAADAARVELRRKDILDHFARRQSDETYIISLGIYTTEGSRDAALSLFRKSIPQVKYQQELVVLPDTSWLHFSSDDRPEVVTQLRGMDWGESGIKLGDYECRSSAPTSSV
ncbi:MAG: SPOR domain-containing protein [Gammaproteobacteria bacterium]|nr:SPOR domain-containing protein [Gammaproteobacteria bacterium]